MKKTVLLASWLLASTSLFAQDPQWKVPLEGAGKWLKMTETGQIIAATGKGLQGINPQTQKVEWTIPLGVLSQEPTLEYLPNSPYAILEENAPATSKTIIFNYLNGRVLFNSQAAEVSVKEKILLPQISALLLEIKQDKKFYLALVDIESGKEQWRNELTNRKGGIGLGTLKQMVNRSLDATPLVDAQGHILYPDHKTLSCLDRNSGKTLWEVKSDNAIGRLHLSPKGNAILMGSGSRIMALDPATGQDLWKNPFKISGAFQQFLSMQDGILVATSAGVVLIDEASGQSKWKDVAEIGVPLVDVRFLPEGILLVGNAEKESSFMLYGTDGKKAWKRPYKAEPLVSYDVFGKGIFFANAEEANIINLANGDDDIWKKRIRLKKSPVTYLGDQMALLYSGENLYEINFKDYSYKQIAEDIDFKGSNEDVQRIEVRKSGYLLSSSQNMWLVAADGKKVYNTYYKAASTGTASKIGGALLKTYLAASNLQNSTTQENGRPMNNLSISEEGQQQMNAVNQLVKNRKNTLSTNDAMYVMTRVETEKEKGVGLVKVDKDSGKEKGKVVLKNLSPIYVVDEVSGKLYVLTNGTLSDASFQCFAI